MSEITTEKKLELVQQVRSQYSKNQYDMSNRERILYGRTSVAEEYGQTPQEEDAAPVSFFKLRMGLALILFGCVVVFDRSGIKIAGTTMETLFQAISADYYGDVAEFVESVTESVEALSADN